ncbi:hypothetical protein CTRI78_v001172 [Colletotrichum trifolii]|uniref:Uncharacterized protein n=1 Tax=Colletotrichum trifolii TaxID=5466 RepID=A0A4R8RTN7_COLTR|nr:hypothetical protein CTRI78_v001172 [Colletotrichum trifolii]
MTKSIVQRPRRRLVQFLFLASSSAATTIISVGDTSLSLSNFQLLTQLSLPLGCLLAYNNPIQGCESTDFGTTGIACSTTCKLGLKRMQDNIQDACQAIQVETNTILGQALIGNLINLDRAATAQHYRPASRTTSASTSTFADISATGITASGITTTGTGTGPAAAAAPTTTSSQHAESCTASAAHFCTSAAAEPASSHPPSEYSYTNTFSTSTSAATTAAAATSLTGTDNNHHLYDHQCDAASPKHTR